MLTIIKIENNEPKGWIVATDLRDARHKLPMGDEWRWLEQWLGRVETAQPGKYLLQPPDGLSGSRFWMLVS